MALDRTTLNTTPITCSRNCFPLTLTVDGHTLVPCSSVKYLGVVITSNLTWSQHIDNTCRSSKRQLGRLHRQFRHVPQSLRRKIYTTTTLPKLDYCCAVWDPHHSTHKKQLEDVQKFAGRVITQSWSSNYDSVCSSLNLQTLSHRRKLQKLKLCYKILNNFSCIPSHVFTPHPHPSPRLHNSRPLYKPFTSTVAHRFSFFIDVVPLWNCLPEYL